MAANCILLLRLRGRWFSRSHTAHARTDRAQYFTFGGRSDCGQMVGDPSITFCNRRLGLTLWAVKYHYRYFGHEPSRRMVSGYAVIQELFTSHPLDK